MQALIGLAAFIGLAIVFSDGRTIPGWRLLAAGLGLQFVFAFLVFNVNLLQQFLGLINRGVGAIVAATE
ncbi:MAG TPA: Na+ dependent nucleoside transporter N-terminal domain-containing protein, partial [Gammaproteobacteria bacterium]|nr:Na+ dependent nucleoside transporter N-terminal domain-containing protein [Gammaproteobacteria bacterium]